MDSLVRVSTIIIYDQFTVLGCTTYSSSQDAHWWTMTGGGSTPEAVVCNYHYGEVDSLRLHWY